VSQSVEPFRIEVPDAVLEDLRERLARTRFPDQLEGTSWEYGTELGYLRALCEYWCETFDWRAQEAALNRLPQFRTSIDALSLHFVHVRSSEPEALPLVITHGWPGSIFEFTKILGPLTDPVAHGGRAEDAFHVVCPSLPGFGFSERPREPGEQEIPRIARRIAQLMERLGYARYGAQGGDWGSFVTRHLALVDPEHVCGIHLNMVQVLPPQGADPFEGLSQHERAALTRAMSLQKEETGYLAIQRTKPQSLGYALNDSPAGLAAWLVEKFRGWSDCQGEIERRFTKDELLTNITIYWVTETITSSLRLYREALRRGMGAMLGEGRVGVPTACALPAAEMYTSPRRWAEHYYHVTRWTELPSGGHFTALEEPGWLVRDIREHFRSVR
jgi:microsomal epoxide hydrolase